MLGLSLVAFAFLSVVVVRRFVGFPGFREKQSTSHDTNMLVSPQALTTTWDYETVLTGAVESMSSAMWMEVLDRLRDLDEGVRRKF